MPKFRRIGILGGAFNPFHIGHLVLADQARQLLRLEKVIFVPTYLSAHKRARALAPARDRYRMVALAIKSNPSFEVSDLEIRRGGISYSVETVRELNSTFRHANLYFIVGSDFLKEFSTWKHTDKLSKICKFVIAQRPGYTFKKLPARLVSAGAGGPARRQGLPKNMRVINVTALDISSTDIRKRIKTKQSMRYLVPEEVRKYILKKKLYC